MTNIYLVRHAQSDTNVKKVFTGQINSSLSELGKKQALAVKEYFKTVTIDKIYSSDLIRCIDTITPMAVDKGLKVVPMSGFREIDSGLWQGLSFFDIERLYADDYNVWRHDLKNATPTGGESIKAMSDRVFNALNNVVKENIGKSIAICTHSVPIRAIVSIILSGDIKEIGNVGWSPNGSITKLVYDGKNYKIEEVGYRKHLGELITELPKNI